MAILKSLKLDSFTINGEKLNSESILSLNTIKKSGNYLIHKAILRHNILNHQRTSSTKTRSEVRGGGRKPWKQKGTGRARVGSNRSPLWKGGGIIFGPQVKKTKHIKINKKERELAINTLIINKKNRLVLISDLEDRFPNEKTSSFINICKKCNIDINQRLLVITAQKSNFLKNSTKNLKNLELISVSQLNAISLIKAEKIILSSHAKLLLTK